MMKSLVPLIAAVLSLAGASAGTADRTIGVFVALADNQSQGIVPVPEAIGNGDDPERNLYWGTAEGLKGVFNRSSHWRLAPNGPLSGNPAVLRNRIYRNAREQATLHAFAYKGSAIKTCIRDFEAAIQAGSYDLVVYIGHNGLMDFDLPMPARSATQTRTPDCIVLCCRSERYFRTRIEKAGGRPVLLTTQLMYPGAFIWRAATHAWLDERNLSVIRDCAGIAYARNQKLSKAAGVGVFADLATPSEQAAQ